MNITLNQEPHLRNCTPFKKWEKENSTNSESTNKKQPALTNWYKTSDTLAKELFALAIYTLTCSFSTFKTPEWKAFYKKLGFKAPGRKALAGDLLSRCYEKLKATVHSVADAVSYIQLVTDGSLNISKQRVENTSFLVDRILYY
jgi:hypothetical protein